MVAAGARVSLAETFGYGVADRPLGTTVTGPEGIAIFSGLVAATAGLSASHPRFLPAKVYGIVASSGTFAFRDVQLPSGGQVRAEVLLRDRPAAGSTCKLLALNTTIRAAPYRVVWQGTTDGLGICRTAAVAAGDYELETDVPEISTKCEKWTTVTEGRETGERIALFPTEISGGVRRSGTGLAGYSVNVIPVVADWPMDAPDLPVTAAKTDEDGHYELTLLMPGRYALQLQSPTGAWVSGVKSVSTFGGEEKTVDFDLAAASLRGVVVDGSQQGVPAANVVVKHAAGAFITSTDSAGNFTVDIQDQGPVHLSANKEGYRGSDPIEVQVGDEVAVIPPITLVIKKADVIDGNVLAADGAPVPGAQISSVVFLNGGPQLFASARSNSDGSFEAPVPPGPALLFVSGPGCPLFAFTPTTGSEPADGEDGAGEVVQCPQDAAALDVTLSDAGGKPIASSGLLLRAGGVVVPRDVLDIHLAGMGMPTLTDGFGQIVLPGLAPGVYDLFLSTRSSAETIAAGNPSGFLATVTLPPRDTVEMQVRYSGNP